MIKTYIYMNDLGARKELVVYPLKNGKHFVTIWCLDNGELTGTGDLTPQELKDFLTHYNIEFDET